MAFVADASMTLAWYPRGEDTESANWVRERLLGEGICVPALGPWKSATHRWPPRGAVVSRCRNCANWSRICSLLPETVDHQTDATAWSATLGLAEEHRLTIYDAAYLELALRRKPPFATLDKQLHGAALALGVALVPEIKK